MCLIHLIVVLLCACSAAGTRVALVGSGVGAASTAFHLRQLLGEGVEIDVYESSNVPGGRTSSMTIDDQIIELGASIAYVGNRYVNDMAKVVGLTTSSPPKPPGGSLFALFDGTDLVFKESPWQIITLIKMLWHYGFAPWQYRTAAASTSANFDSIYTLQDNRTAFESPIDMLRSMELYDLTQINFKEYIVDNMGSYGGFASEFVAAAGLCNYNQDTEQLNALAGLVSLLPATDPRVFRVDRGNQELTRRVLEYSNVSLYLNARVISITKQQQPNLDGERGVAGGYILDADCTIKNNINNNINNNSRACAAAASLPYDAVVIATPLESAHIDIIGVQLPVIPKRDYQTTVTTVVKGALRPTFFGLDPGHMPYSEILITEIGSKSLPFRSLSRVGSGKGNLGIYKMFSTAPIPHAWLSILFDETGFEVVVNKTWAAYPRFDPPENFAKFRLDNGLYYNNALENGASAMETAAVAGRNSALLVAQHLASSGFVGGLDSNPEDATLRIQRGGAAKFSAAAAA